MKEGEEPPKAKRQRFVRCDVRFADSIPAGEDIEWIDCKVTFALPEKT